MLLAFVRQIEAHETCYCTSAYRMHSDYAVYALDLALIYRAHVDVRCITVACSCFRESASRHGLFS